VSSEAAHLAEGERAGARYRLAGTDRPRAGLAGLATGTRTGSSLEFQDHREYQPGDDLRTLDWSALARTDRLVVKRFHEEVTPHLDLLLDGSRSMALPGSEKARASLGLTALLAVAAGNAGFTHAVWLSGEACEPVAHGAQPPGAWRGVKLDGRSSPADALRRLPPSFRPRALRILVSDLLFDGDPELVLERLSRGGAATVVVQLLAESDRSPEAAGAARLEDSESGEREEIVLDREALRRYAEALSRHQEVWRRAARRAGVRLFTLVAEELVAGWAPRELLADGILVPK